MGSSFLTRDETWAFCNGSTESWPLDHQRGPLLCAFDVLFKKCLLIPRSWRQCTLSYHRNLLFSLSHLDPCPYGVPGVWQGSGVVFWVALRGVAPSCSGTIFVSHLCTCESGNSCTGLSVCPTLVLCWLLRLCNESWCWQLYSSSGWFYLFLALCISNSVFFFFFN